MPDIFAQRFTRWLAHKSLQFIRAGQVILRVITGFCVPEFGCDWGEVWTRVCQNVGVSVPKFGRGHGWGGIWVWMGWSLGLVEAEFGCGSVRASV